jgi:hypothetical protein
MGTNTASYLTDLRDFTLESMNWCSQEAETEAMRVSEILNALVNDAGRRASMSQQALEATRIIQKKIELLRATDGADKITDLVKILEQISNEHTELDNLTGPIIEALQFQDRLRQNLENLGKILNVWLVERSSIENETTQLAYGKKLVSCMTSEAERSVIRSFIAGLPEEEKVEDAMFF